MSPWDTHGAATKKRGPISARFPAISRHKKARPPPGQTGLMGHHGTAGRPHLCPGPGQSVRGSGYAGVIMPLVVRAPWVHTQAPGALFVAVDCGQLSHQCPTGNKKARAISRKGLILWSRRKDSNPRPTDYKSVALPTELRRLETVRARPFNVLRFGSRPYNDRHCTRLA
jgi:hypothetical protein